MADVVGLYRRFGVRLPEMTGNGWASVRCFTGAHQDRHPSARVHLTAGTFRCFACGARGGVLDALNYLGVSDRAEARRYAVDYGILDPPRRKSRPRPIPLGVRPIPAPAEPKNENTFVDWEQPGAQIIHDRSWVYLDSTGSPVGQVRRLDLDDGTKRIWQERATDDGFISGMAGKRLPLYRLPEVLERAATGSRILLVEGEKTVDALDRLGHFATTNPGGAGKWDDSYTEALAGATVLVITDCDLVGRLHAMHITRLLHLHPQITALAPFDIEPGRSDGFDLVDHLAGVAATIRATAPELDDLTIRARLSDHVRGLLAGQLHVDSNALQHRLELAVYTDNPAGHTYTECPACGQRRVHRLTHGYAYCPCGGGHPAP